MRSAGAERQLFGAAFLYNHWVDGQWLPRGASRVEPIRSCPGDLSENFNAPNIQPIG